MVRMVWTRNPEYIGSEKTVLAEVALEGPYTPGGMEMKPVDYGISTITFVDDAIGEGYLVRFNVDSPHPPKLQVFGTSPTGMAEADSGADLDYVDTIRCRIRGW